MDSLVLNPVYMKPELDVPINTEWQQQKNQSQINPVYTKGKQGPFPFLYHNHMWAEFFQSDLDLLTISQMAILDHGFLFTDYKW